MRRRARRIVAPLAGACLSWAGLSRAQGAPWNIVIVDICSARADHMSVYGYSRQTTPGIEALGRESAVFENAMAQSSWCLPNYASLFTGHVPEVHGQYAYLPHRGLPEFERPLAQRLKAAGYKTAAFSGGVYFLPAWASLDHAARRPLAGQRVAVLGGRILF